jgi:hypothetical protein
MFASNKYDNFVDQVNRSFLIPELKGDLVAMSIALGLGSILPIPTTPVEVPRVYFNENCASTILTYVSEVNERMIIDVGLARELTFAFWFDRYSALHRADFVSRLSDFSEATNYFDFTRPSRLLFTPEQAVILQENGRLVLNAATVFIGIIETDAVAASDMMISRS